MADGTSFTLAGKTAGFRPSPVVVLLTLHNQYLHQLCAVETFDGSRLGISKRITQKVIQLCEGNTRPQPFYNNIIMFLLGTRAPNVDDATIRRESRADDAVQTCTRPHKDFTQGEQRQS